MQNTPVNTRFKIGLLITTLSLTILGCSSENVVAERVTDDNGVISVCGVGPGLTPCPYYSDDSVKLETNKQLEKEADSVNKDTPAQREQTIEQIEAGDTP